MSTQTAIDPDIIEKYIVEDSTLYNGEDYCIHIGTNRYLGKQLLGTVSKTNHSPFYDVIEAGDIIIPCQITGHDKFGRPQSIAMADYIEETMLLLQLTNEVVVTGYQHDEPTMRFTYSRSNSGWKLIQVYNYRVASLLNRVFTLKPGCRPRIAKKLGVSITSEYVRAFDAAVSKLSLI